MSPLVQGLRDTGQRFDFDPFSGPQIQVLDWGRLVTSAAVRSQSGSANPPKQPDTDELRHFKDAAVARANSAEGFSEPFASGQLDGRVQYFAGLTKVSFRTGRGFEPGSQLLFGVFCVNIRLARA